MHPDCLDQIKGKHTPPTILETGIRKNHPVFVQLYGEYPGKVVGVDFERGTVQVSIELELDASMVREKEVEP